MTTPILVTGGTGSLARFVLAQPRAARPGAECSPGTCRGPDLAVPTWAHSARGHTFSSPSVISMTRSAFRPRRPRVRMWATDVPVSDVTALANQFKHRTHVEGASYE